MATLNDLFLFNSTPSPYSAAEVYGNGSLDPTSPPCTDWTPVPFTTVIPTVYGIICVVGTLANALAVFVLVCGSKTGRTVADIFMLNLCVSDLLFLLSLPLWAVYYSRSYSWPFGRAACKICGALLHLNLYASIFFITSMSVDRYLAIVHPLRSLSARNPKLACLTCIMVWFLACVCTAPTFALRDTIQLEGLEVEVCGILCPSQSCFLALAWMKILLGFLLPLFAISYCYCTIGRHLLAYRDLMRMQTSAHSLNVFSQEGDRKPDRPPTPSVSPSFCEDRPPVGNKVERVLLTVAAVVLAFFLCWFPFHCVTFLDFLKTKGWLGGCSITWTINNLTPLTLCLGFSNSAINPVLYCFIGNHFRDRLGNLCKGLCACLKARKEEHHRKRSSISTRLSSFSRKLSDLKDLAIVEISDRP
ncbi:type-2 angiotensin II receptor [Kryptolebias marmoratus]|uniref:Angiotensin II receptor, type 2 n=1 Tax=Kryptolebias marmoratus TaxID=37003 RepID=A0A3Q3AXM9_KRYMA|nr:type-2 angiotensin II receptor [Kryptolebias marmoratus]